MFRKAKICLKCGDKGDVKRLIFCIECKACAEHSYCQDKFHTEDDGTIFWKCEDCAPNNPQKCVYEELRKSKRITQAAEAKYKRMKMLKESVVVRKQKSVRSSKGFHAECLMKNDIEKGQPILEEKNVLSEETESAKGPLNFSSEKQAVEHEKYVDSEALTSQHLYYPEFDRHIPAYALSNPVWRGQFILNNATDFGLVAYVSSKACSKVHSAATMLPRQLDLEMFLRVAVWPKSFNMLPPNGDSIGLYFFPLYERQSLTTWSSSFFLHIYYLQEFVKSIICGVFSNQSQ